MSAATLADIQAEKQAATVRAEKIARSNSADMLQGELIGAVFAVAEQIAAFRELIERALAEDLSDARPGRG